MKKNIFIFGGSFDPIHNGHLTLIKQTLKQVDNIEKFFVVPAGCHPEGKKYLFTNQERLMMIRCCLSMPTQNDRIILKELDCSPMGVIDDPRIEICEDEINSLNCSFTIDTVRKMHERYPEFVLNLLCGADHAVKFSQWRSSEELAELASLWTFLRNEYFCDPRYYWNFINFPKQNVSSSQIKEFFLHGVSFNEMKIPHTVYKLMHLFLEKNPRI